MEEQSLFIVHLHRGTDGTGRKHPVKAVLNSYFFVLFLLLLFGSVFTALAQDENEILINPQNLLATADEEIFKRFSFQQDFSEDQGYVNELPNPVTIHQYYIYDGIGSDVLMTMHPSEVTIHTTNKRLNFEQVRNREFHVTYSVSRTEDIPEEGGGRCWIRYSNTLLKGAGKESGIIFYPGDQAYFFTPEDGEMTYTAIADLSDLDLNEWTNFDFIRLNGVIYVYTNGKFRFSYEDGISDYVSFEGGAELFVDGTRVHCVFDDFSMRIK